MKYLPHDRFKFFPFNDPKLNDLKPIDERIEAWAKINVDPDKAGIEVIANPKGFLVHVNFYAYEDDGQPQEVSV